MLLSNGFIKLSIIAFYRRIFVTQKNSVFDIVTKIFALVIFLWTMTFILLLIFGCGGHVTANWGSPNEQSIYCDAIGYTSEEGFAISGSYFPDLSYLCSSQSGAPRHCLGTPVLPLKA